MCFRVVAVLEHGAWLPCLGWRCRDCGGVVRQFARARPLFVHALWLPHVYLHAEDVSFRPCDVSCFLHALWPDVHVFVPARASRSPRFASRENPYVIARAVRLSCAFYRLARVCYSSRAHLLLPRIESPCQRGVAPLCHAVALVFSRFVRLSGVGPST